MLRAASLMLVCLSVLGLAGCGGGGTTALDTSEPKISDFSPPRIHAQEPASFLLVGSGFNGLPADARVRLVAMDGAPFDNGTSASVTLEPGTRQRGQIRGAIPALQVSNDVRVHVQLVSAGRVLADTGYAVLEVLSQEVTRISHHMASSDDPIRLTIEGRGFHPVGGSATVTYTAVPGTAFVGGRAVSVGATITSATEISVFSPRADALAPVEAAVRVALTSGTVLRAPDGEHILIEPSPFVHRMDPSDVLALQAPTVRITGYGFVTEGPRGSGDEQATVVLRAADGSPFHGGTRAEFEFPAAILDNNNLEATLPPIDITEVVRASMHVRLPNDAVIRSRSQVAHIHPQALFAVRPSVYEAGVAGRPLSVEGVGFSPAAGDAVLHLDAGEETPFLQGTASTVDIPLRIQSGTTATGTWPNLRVWSDATATVRLSLPGGLTLAGGEIRLIFKRQYIAYDNLGISLGKEAATGVETADFDGDGTPDLAFSHAATRPHVYLNGGLGAFPTDMNEVINAGPARKMIARNFDNGAPVDLYFGGDGSGGGGPDPEAQAGIVEEKEHHAWYRNTGSAFFNTSPSWSNDASSWGTLVASKLADYDGDGRLDFLFAYRGDAKRTVEVWRGFNGGGFSYQARRTESIGTLSEDVTDLDAADLDGDGSLDLIVLANGGGYILRGTTRDRFSLAANLFVTGGRKLRLIDLDGDADLDLVVGTHAEVLLLENTDRVNFRYELRASLPIDGTNEIVLHDADADGDADLLIARGEKGAERSTLLYDNEGAFVFADTGLRTPAAVTADVLMTDFDGDGRADLVEANAGGKRIFFAGPKPGPDGK